MRQLPLLVCTVVIMSAAANVWASDEQDCFQSQAPQPRIKGCSEIIRRAPNDATAFHNRAVAYGLAGDTDSAIADYSKAIEIAPDNASAYDNRARAYAWKGDYTHAVADQTRANELIARAMAQATATITATAPKTATIPPKRKAHPNVSKKIGHQTSGSWWSWYKFSGESADDASVRNVKLWRWRVLSASYRSALRLRRSTLREHGCAH
jgi:tetratricopeptide (TPR) repeat protein